MTFQQQRGAGQTCGFQGSFERLPLFAMKMTDFDPDNMIPVLLHKRGYHFNIHVADILVVIVISHTMPDNIQKGQHTGI